MNRRFFIATVTAATLLARFASAASYQDSIVAELRGAGYRRISVESTWLGRVRIRGIKGKELREIVLNPRTGEVLRDVVQLQSDSSGRSNSDQGGKRASSDNSGSGNSGSGNSGSGSGDSGDDGSDDGGSDDNGSNSGSGSDDKDENDDSDKDRDSGGDDDSSDKDDD